MLWCFSSQLIEDCCYLLWTGNIFSFLEKLRMYKRHPHGHGGDKKSTTNKLGMEKCEDSIWKGGVTKFFPQSCQNGFLLAPFGWEHLTFRAKFPKKWKPKLQLVDQDVQHIVPIPWWPWQIFQGSSCRMLSQPQPRLLPSHPTWFSTLWLQLFQGILVGQPPEGCLCVPGAVPGARAEIPRIFCVACGLSSPPQLGVKQAGEGPRKGKLGVCLSKSHGSELVAIIP